MSDRKDLIIPPASVIGDGRAEFSGDVVFSDHTTVSMDVSTEGRIFAGQGVTMAGSLSAVGDISIDRSSEVASDVTSEGSVFAGERVSIGGKVHARDLDVASEVEIEGGFDVHGWINVRSPVPLMIQFFIVLMELLRQGRSDEVEKILEELEEMQEIQVNEGYAFVPSGGRVAEDLFTKGGCRVGDRSHVPPISAGDWVRVGFAAEVMGEINAGGDATLAEGVLVHGGVTAGGRLILGPDVRVGGDLKARSVTMARTAVVSGEIVAPGGLKFTEPPKVEIEERLGKFEVGMEAVGEMLQ
jgi:predicted acyltransferase (DUF342 family)